MTKPFIPCSILELYSVYFTDANTGYFVGDNGTIKKTTNGGIISISDNESSSQKSMFNIYPNPVTDKITITIPDFSASVILTIYTASGVAMKTITLHEPVITIDISTFPTGIYIARFESKKFLTTGKFIKIK